MIEETKILLETADAQEIALWKIANTKTVVTKNIFLTHGTFSDKRICLGIANYLAVGYTCWIMEWRNHGASGKINKPFNFETIALFDIKAVFDYLFQQVAISDIHGVTHSGGGICLTMFLIKNPAYITKTKSISLFGCQAFGAALSTRKYISTLLTKNISRIMGYMPGKKIGRPHDESYFTMKQWFDWNLQQNFKGANDYDYLKEMPTVKIPILSFCGKNDKSVAPIEGCTTFLNAFKNPANKLLHCGIETGCSEDYDHSRIILSKSASIELWPKTLEWIRAQEVY